MALRPLDLELSIQSGDAFVLSESCVSDELWSLLRGLYDLPGVTRVKLLVVRMMTGTHRLQMLECLTPVTVALVACRAAFCFEDAPWHLCAELVECLRFRHRFAAEGPAMTRSRSFSEH